MQKLITLVTTVLLLACTANATAFLSLQNGSSDAVAIYDTGTISSIGNVNTTGSSHTSGAGVAWQGTLGSLWTVDITASLTSSGTPGMLLNANVTSSGAGTLTINWSGGPFTGSITPFVSANGSTPGSILYQWMVDGAIVGTAGTFGPGSFSGSASGSGPTSSAYSLSEFLTITSSGAGSTRLTASISPASVPDSGSTIALLSFALAGLAGLRRQLGR